jgi:hypothetical protein
METMPNPDPRGISYSQIVAASAARVMIGCVARTKNKSLLECSVICVEMMVWLLDW